jgi:hypothetical protein
MEAQHCDDSDCMKEDKNSFRPLPSLSVGATFYSRSLKCRKTKCRTTKCPITKSQMTKSQTTNNNTYSKRQNFKRQNVEDKVFNDNKRQFVEWQNVKVCYAKRLNVE